MTTVNFKSVGTNILLLPTEAFDSMKTVFLELCTTNTLTGICNVDKHSTLFDGKCFNMTTADIAKFPNFTLSMPGVDLSMSPKVRGK